MKPLKSFLVAVGLFLSLGRLIASEHPILLSGGTEVDPAPCLGEWVLAENGVQSQSTECQTAGNIKYTVAINGATVSVSATSFREYESMDKNIHLRKTFATTNEVKELTYQDRVREVSNVVPLAGNRVGIFGELSRGGNQIAVVDLDLMSLIAQTHSFEYEVSPSGRYIVFRSWCPKMGLPAFRFSVIMGLDVEGIKTKNEKDWREWRRSNSSRILNDTPRSTQFRRRRE